MKSQKTRLTKRTKGRSIRKRISKRNKYTKKRRSMRGG